MFLCARVRHGWQHNRENRGGSVGAWERGTTVGVWAEDASTLQRDRNNRLTNTLFLIFLY